MNIKEFIRVKERLSFFNSNFFNYATALGKLYKFPFNPHSINKPNTLRSNGVAMGLDFKSINKLYDMDLELNNYITSNIEYKSKYRKLSKPYSLCVLYKFDKELNECKCFCNELSKPIYDGIYNNIFQGYEDYYINLAKHLVSIKPIKSIS